MAATEWDLFQSLHAVMEAGSLSAAAKLRGLTQPTLGRHIDTLERRLGAPLFLRTPRGLQPTDLALELKPHLAEMAAAASAAIRDASGAADSVTGSIRITTSEMMGAEVVPAILAAFHLEHPNVALELMLSNATDDLSRREADIAVRMTPPTQSALVAKKVGEVALGFHASPAYLARHPAPMSVDDLSSHTLIGFDQVKLAEDRIEGINLKITRDLFQFRSDSDVAQLAAMRAGFGIGVCQPAFGRRHGLTPVMSNVVVFRLGVWIVMHENLKASRRMRLMFDHLVTGMSAWLAQNRPEATEAT